MKTFLVGAIVLAVSLALNVWVPAAHAQSEATGLLIPCDQEIVSVPSIGSDGKTVMVDQFANPCTIDSFFQQFVVLAQWGQSIVIILAVLFIIWGGVQWITAAGRPSKIEDGKRIVIGAIVGVIISMTAYITINFAVAAITGTTARAINPFSGPIATVFGGTSSERPFSGTGGTETRTDCHATWDNGCTADTDSAIEIRCADPGTQPGPIARLQEALDAKGCECLSSLDGKGCYGDNTASCVRRFQLANLLPATGMVDTRTENLILSNSSQSCSSPSTTVQRINKIEKLLPQFDINLAAKKSRTTLGCCVVRGTDASGNTQPLYCADSVSERSCGSLPNSQFYSGSRSCFQQPEASQVCGSCINPDNSKTCFEQASPYWCSSVLPTEAQFVPSPCFGINLCTTKCDESLFTDFSQQPKN